MKLIAAIIVIAAIAAGVLGPQFLFVVDETQAAIVTRLGEPRRSIVSPGLYAKTPFVETVTYFDRRSTLFDADPDSFLTQDKKRLIIDAYAIGRIEDPLRFFESVRTARGAEQRGKDIVVSDLKIEIANDLQIDVIRDRREAIMNKVTETVRPKLGAFGIDTVDVRLKRADFPPQIASSVYANMDAERKRIANAERAEGARQDLEIRADVDRRATIIRAEAQRDAAIIQGCGLAEANAIYAGAFSQNPEFYRFQRSLEVFKSSLTGNMVAVGSAGDLGQLFGEIREGVAASVELPGAEGSENGPSDVGPTCAQVAAAQLLAGDLVVDQSEIELVSFEQVDWPDSSLGCPQEGRFYIEGTVPGYKLLLDYQGTSYEVHTNEFGSRQVTCNITQTEPEPTEAESSSP